jgi:hypothetical protein
MEPRNYHAYLIRLWRESDHDPWRVTLEDVHTGERTGFAGLDRLLAHLRQKLREDDGVEHHAAGRADAA